VGGQKLRFSIDEPVAGRALFDRERELRQIREGCIESVRTPGERCFFALIGLRKVGKSTIIHELKRHYEAVPDLYVVILDCYDRGYHAERFFAYYIVQVVNEFLRRQGYAEEVGTFPDPHDPEYLRVRPLLTEKLRALRSPALETAAWALDLLEQAHPSPPERAAAYFTPLFLPQRLAEEAHIYFQLIFDEFQELAKLNRLPQVQETVGNLFGKFRAHWILDRIPHRVNYMITGSRLGQLRFLIASPREPLFGHFHSYGIGNLNRPDARQMIQTLLKEAGYVLDPPELLKELLDLSDGHPYYIREILQAVCSRAVDAQAAGSGPRVVTEGDFRQGVQDVFFGETGSLNLYFQQYFRDYLEDYAPGREVLISLAAGNTTAEEVAADLRQAVPTVKKHLEELEYWNAIKGRNRDQYYVANPVFNFWLRGAMTRYRRVAGPFLVGSEVERQLALFLLEHGIDLVYQSYMSRGPFDLLMEHGGVSIAVQVRKVERFAAFLSRAAYARMQWYIEEYGKRDGVLCLYGDGTFRFYRLADLNPTKRGYSVTQKTPYTENPITLL
jgi:AAA+ ATPase superfamily predicted ATPase